MTDDDRYLLDKYLELIDITLGELAEFCHSRLNREGSDVVSEAT